MSAGFFVSTLEAEASTVDPLHNQILDPNENLRQEAMASRKIDSSKWRHNSFLS